MGNKEDDYNAMRNYQTDIKEKNKAMKYLRWFCMAFLLLFAMPVVAHTLPFDFENMSQGNIGWVYLKMGFAHIIPLGFDHILFILGVFLLKPELKTVIWQATAFTIAHSITLGLAIYGFISPSAGFIEPVIALSIVFIAIENIIAVDLKWWRVILIFLFGLIHGCGFAGVLAETGLPKNDFLLALLSFNGGVELGQISIILVAWLISIRFLNDRHWYRTRVTIPLSLCISLIAIYWTVERVL